MAAIALDAELAQVPIVLVMTGIAFLAHFSRTRRFGMARRACQLAVRAKQRKVRILRVIEGPDLPAVGRVAAVALLAERTFMHILARMASDAGGRRSTERLSCMALSAADQTMQPDQRIRRQIVIERDLGMPGVLAMAFCAAAGDLAGMRVFAAMAPLTVLGQLLGCLGDVTGVAVELRVRALQRELVPRRVIVVHRVPLVVIVAVLALRTEAHGVGIVGAMTSIAILGDLILVVAASMARETVDVGMYAEQGESGFLEVIEFGGFPLLGGMAFAAIRAARTAVFIVGGMATDAAFRGLLVAAADVARIAGERGMRAIQLEVGLVVIEFAAAPRNHAVAFAARLRELRLVHVIARVAIDTRRRRLSPGGFGLMAGGAIESGVRPVQRKLGEPMIELSDIKLHDVRFAPFMLGVASAAFPRAAARHAAVKSRTFAYIGGHVFVAVKTQRGLRHLVAAIVATGTRLL